jgi:hypothetical protein
MFYWMDSVQAYEDSGWNYLTELHSFVDGGMQNDAFIDAVSGIVNRGCQNPPCATGSVDGGPERLANFRTVLAALLQSPTGSPVAAPSIPTPTVPAPVFPPTSNTPVAAPVAAPIVAPMARSGAPIGTSWSGVMCCETGENSYKATPGCGSFYQCVNGQVFPNSLITYPAGLVFDVSITACNWGTDCQAQECPTSPPVAEGG